MALSAVMLSQLLATVEVHSSAGCLCWGPSLAGCFSAISWLLSWNKKEKQELVGLINCIAMQ